MFDVLEMIYLRLAKLFAKNGYLDASGEAVPPEDGDLRVPLPFIPRAPKAYRRKGRLLANPLYQQPDPDVMSVQSWLDVRDKWFSFHAAVSIEGPDRAGLRQLFHYGANSRAFWPSQRSRSSLDGVVIGLIQSCTRDIWKRRRKMS